MLVLRSGVITTVLLLLPAGPPVLGDDLSSLGGLARAPGRAVPHGGSQAGSRELGPVPPARPLSGVAR